MGKPWQQPGRPDIGEETDADLRHREYASLARHAMRSVQPVPDSAAHDEPIDQCDIRLRKPLDALVEDIFLAPEGQLRRMVAGSTLLVELADVAPRAKRTTAGGDDDARNGRVAFEVIQRTRDRANHSQGQRVERAWTIEDNEPC